MRNDLLNLVRREVQRTLRALVADPRVAIVQSFDAARYAATVQLMPEGTQTGWLPILVDWMGNGWGSLAPLSQGDQVLIVFQEHDMDSGIIAGRLYDQRNAPPQSAPSGERWLVHESASFIKLTNDPKIIVNGSVEIDLTAPTINITATQAVNVTSPQVTVNASTEVLLNTPILKVSGDIIDNYQTNPHTVAVMREIFDIHTHNVPDVEGGSSTVVSNVPNQQE